MFFLPSDSLKQAHFRVIPTGPAWFGFCHHLAECFHKGSNSTIARRDSRPSGVMNSCVSVGIRYALTKVSALGIGHAAFCDYLTITDIPGPHISTLNVLNSFCDGFNLFFYLIQPAFLLNIQKGHFGDQLCLRFWPGAFFFQFFPAIYQLAVNSGLSCATTMMLSRFPSSLENL
jgi:hypothetical protein